VAADVATRYPERAGELGVDQAEIERWQRAADSIVVPFDDELGVTQQSEGFTRYRRWDFTKTTADDYPLLLHFPYYQLYSSQVIKQADLVFALYVCGECFTPEQKRRDFDYYEQITVRDSSLSASIQSIVAAEVGHLDLAYRYFRETALVDLQNLAGNTKDGLHLASLAGACLAVVAGFGGLRNYGHGLSFSPRLPEPLTMIRFRLMLRGRCIRVEIGREQTCYELIDGDPITIYHYGEEVTLRPDRPQPLACPPMPSISPVEPPAGRQPEQEGVGQNGES
jgi:alpha,alpha-trehalose phosphorylase